MLEQHINLNIIPSSEPIVVHVNQYDYSEERIHAHLYKDTQTYTPGSSVTAKIQGTKPDKRAFEYPATISGNEVYCNLEDQMTACAGDVRCQFVLSTDDSVIGTFCFILKVQPSALADDADTSDTVLPSYIDAAATNAARAETAASDAMAWASHSPYINPNNSHWMVYDVGQHTWVDTGISADGSTTSYSTLINKPTINEVELVGDMSASDLGLQTELEIDENGYINL